MTEMDFLIFQIIINIQKCQIDIEAFQKFRMLTKCEYSSRDVLSYHPRDYLFF